MRINSPRPPGISTEALAYLGMGEVAYVKPIRSDDVQHLFPDAPVLQPGLRLFALHSANGVPILVTDTKEAAIANAMQNELKTVSLH